MSLQEKLDMRHFERLNDNLFHNHPDAIYLFDLEGNFTMVNEVVCYMTGLARETLVGSSFQALIHEDWLKDTVERFLLCVQDVPQRYETVVRTKQGLRYLDVTNFPYKEGERVQAVFGIAKDITESKEKELQLQRHAALLEEQNAELEVMRRVLAHDLRRPLANAKGFAQLLQGGALPAVREAEVKEMLCRTMSAMDAMVISLNEVIALKAAGSEVREVVLIAECIAHVLQFHARDIEGSGASVTVDVDQGLRLYTVRTYLDSVLRNLVSNALKYRCKDRNLKLKISAAVAREMVSIAVEDNGIGMNMRVVSGKLFKMQKRFAPSVAEGEGLGLYLVKEQVRLLGGTISVESELGTGSVFTVTLPTH